MILISYMASALKISDPFTLKKVDPVSAQINAQVNNFQLETNNVDIQRSVVMTRSSGLNLAKFRQWPWRDHAGDRI